MLNDQLILKRACLGIVMMILSFPAEAGGALPDSVDGAGRPQSTRVTQLGALMNKFSSDSIQLADNQAGMSYSHKIARSLSLSPPSVETRCLCSVDPRVWCQIPALSQFPRNILQFQVARNHGGLDD
jgi:hypothetical protein